MQRSTTTGSTPDPGAVRTRRGAEAVRYEGLLRIGTGTRVREVPVRIPDVEEPNWFGIVDGTLDTVPKGEVVVALLDDGVHRDWTGTAIVALGGDERVRLLGHEPLTPPTSGHHAA